MEQIAVISNVWTNMISLKKGEVYEGHSHTFDHTHLLTLGKVKITADGEETIFEAPTVVFIKRGVLHSIECLSEESVGTCIHVIRNGKRIEDIVDPRMMPSYSEDDRAVDSTMFLSPGKFVESKAHPWEEESSDNPNAEAN